MKQHKEDPLSMVNPEEVVPFSSEERERSTKRCCINFTETLVMVAWKTWFGPFGQETLTPG